MVWRPCRMSRHGLTPSPRSEIVASSPAATSRQRQRKHPRALLRERGKMGRQMATLSPTHEAPYRGLKVLDFGQGIASPYCAMLLAVYGADVIKVEPPEGDWSRFLGTTYGSHTTLSAVYNRGKRSLCLDLKHKDGSAVGKRLPRDCDILIEGFRPGVAARLGLGYEELSRDNPRLIYLSVSGFGQSGPYAKRPGSDSVAQAFSGLVSVNIGTDGVPHRV